MACFSGRARLPPSRDVTIRPRLWQFARLRGPIPAVPSFPNSGLGTRIPAALLRGPSHGLGPGNGDEKRSFSKVRSQAGAWERGPGGSLWSTPTTRIRFETAAYDRCENHFPLSGWLGRNSGRASVESVSHLGRRARPLNRAQPQKMSVRDLSRVRSPQPPSCGHVP